MPDTFTKQECLDSLARNGCKKIGANRWEDRTHFIKLRSRRGAFYLEATKKPGVVFRMRDALRPIFLTSHA